MGFQLPVFEFTPNQSQRQEPTLKTETGTRTRIDGKVASDALGVFASPSDPGSGPSLVL